MPVVGFYRLIAKCDNNPGCVAKTELVAVGDQWICCGEFTGKSYSTARMAAIRAGWRISKEIAICRFCRQAGIRGADIRRKLGIYEKRFEKRKLVKENVKKGK